MGKKKKSDGYTSMGLHSNVSKDTLKAMRKERSHLDTMINKYDAFKKGKNVMLTIPNPNANAKNNGTTVNMKKSILYTTSINMKIKCPISNLG